MKDLIHSHVVSDLASGTCPGCAKELRQQRAPITGAYLHRGAHVVRTIRETTSVPEIYCGRHCPYCLERRNDDSDSGDATD